MMHCSSTDYGRFHTALKRAIEQKSFFVCCKQKPVDFSHNISVSVYDAKIPCGPQLDAHTLNILVESCANHLFSFLEGNDRYIFNGNYDGHVVTAASMTLGDMLRCKVNFVVYVVSRSKNSLKPVDESEPFVVEEDVSSTKPIVPHFNSRGAKVAIDDPSSVDADYINHLRIQDYLVFVASHMIRNCHAKEMSIVVPPKDDDILPHLLDVWRTERKFECTEDEHATKPTWHVIKLKWSYIWGEPEREARPETRYIVEKECIPVSANNGMQDFLDGKI